MLYVLYTYLYVNFSNDFNPLDINTNIIQTLRVGI